MIEVMTKEAFHAVQGVSYSKLSKLADGPRIYRLSLEHPPKGSRLDLGSVVDKLSTDRDHFDDEFYVMTADIPESAMMKTFAEVYAETGDQENAWRQSGFKIGLDRVLGKFQTEGIHYYNALILGKDKKVVDAAMVMKANQIVTELRSNPFTQKYFTPENDYIEIKFQVPIIWKQEITDLRDNQATIEETFKGIIDILITDHKDKIIYVIDIKTGSEGFWKSFWKFKYYLQGAMYYYGALQEFKDYEVIPTKFIYADANLIYPPTIFSMTTEDVVCGKFGYYAKSISSNISKLKYKGFVQLAEELNWHTATDNWEYPYEVYMNGGEVEIDAFSVKL